MRIMLQAYTSTQVCYNLHTKVSAQPANMTNIASYLCIVFFAVQEGPNAEFSCMTQLIVPPSWHWQLLFSSSTAADKGWLLVFKLWIRYMYRYMPVSVFRLWQLLFSRLAVGDKIWMWLSNRQLHSTLFPAFKLWTLRSKKQRNRRCPRRTYRYMYRYSTGTPLTLCTPMLSVPGTGIDTLYMYSTCTHTVDAVSIQVYTEYM